MLEFKKYSSIENSFSREFMEHVVAEMPQDLEYVVQGESWSLPFGLPALCSPPVRSYCVLQLYHLPSSLAVVFTETTWWPGCSPKTLSWVAGRSQAVRLKGKEVATGKGNNWALDFIFLMPIISKKGGFSTVIFFQSCTFFCDIIIARKSAESIKFL